MWELGHKEGWALKNWCFQIVVLEKTLESPLDNKAIKPVSPKENQPWIFIGRADTEAEAPILGPPDVEEPIHWKRPWCWERLNKRKRDQQRIRWLDSITDSADRNLSKLLEIVKDKGVLWCIPWYCRESGMLSNWTAATKGSVNTFGLLSFTVVDRDTQKSSCWTKLRGEHTQWMKAHGKQTFSLSKDI